MSILDWVSSHKGLNWDMLLMRRQMVFWGIAGLDQGITQWHQDFFILLERPTYSHHMRRAVWFTRTNPEPTAPAQGPTLGPWISSQYLMAVRVPLPCP